MVQRLRLLPATARASHFHLRPGSAILQLVVPLVTVKADSPAAFPRLAREKGSRPVVAAVVFAAGSSPEFARFAFVPCLGSICFAIADLVIAAADPFSLVRSDLAAVVAVPGPDSAVAADLVCFSGSVCSFAVGMAKGKAVVGISCFLTPRSSF